MKGNMERMIELLKDKDVIQLLFDVLHKRRQKYSTADNSGQHVEYKEMVKDLKNDYKQKLNDKIK